MILDVKQAVCMIKLPAGAPKVVEFDFDLGSDTAISVASEMVEEMSLSHSDAARIAQAIKEEIFNLTQKVQSGQHRAAASYGSVSDDESAATRPPPSESGMTAASDGLIQEGNISDVKYEARHHLLLIILPWHVGHRGDRYHSMNIEYLITEVCLLISSRQFLH